MFLISSYLSKNTNFEIQILTGNDFFKKKKIGFKKNTKIFVYLPLKKRFFNIFRRLINILTSLIIIWPDFIIIMGVGGKGIIHFIPLTFCKIFKRKKFIFSIASDGDVDRSKGKGLIKFLYISLIRFSDLIVFQKDEQLLKLELWKQKKFINSKIIKSGFPLPNTTISQKSSILWVGTTRPLKQPELFVDLAQKFPQEKFIMICRNSSRKIYWKNLIEKGRELLNLTILEFVPFNEIDFFFRESKVLINTSTFEGFPNTFLQAFKNKTPVISLNVNPDKIFTMNNIGFYCRNSFNEMEKNLKILLENKELYNKYSENSYNYIKDNHNITHIVDEWKKLFESF